MVIVKGSAFVLERKVIILPLMQGAGNFNRLVSARALRVSRKKKW